MDPLDSTKLANSLQDWRTWLVLVVAAACGLLGGVAHHFVSPAEPETSFYGFLFIGAAAALAALLFINPSDGVRLVALSVLAGYSGKALLDAADAKTRTVLAREDAARSRAEGLRAIEAGKEALRTAQELANVNAVLKKQLLDAADDKKRSDIMGALKRALPPEHAAAVDKPADAYHHELQRISSRLDAALRVLEKR
jgi:hypothetical protein